MTLYEFIQKIKRWLAPAAVGAIAATTVHTNVLESIKNFEGGCSGGECVSYVDPVGVPTIGYGHTNRAGTVKFELGDVWTEEYATTVLDQDLQKFWDAVDAAVTVPLNQCQHSVLTSWTYNVGPTAMSNSTLVRLLNQGHYDQVPAQLARWNKAGGRTLRGLTKRRALEGELWNTNCAEVQSK